MLIFLVASFISRLQLQVPIDEISAVSLLSSVTQDDYTAFIVVRGGQQQPIEDLYIIDHESRKIRLLDDGRVRLTTSSRVFATAKGFTVIDGTQKMLYEISPDCVYVDSYRLDQLAELGSSIKLKASAVIDKDHLALTYLSLEDMGTLYLAKFNLTQKSLETLHAAEVDNGYWAYNDEQWLFIDDKTGRMDLLDKGFKKVSELNPGQKKFQYPMKAEIRALLEERGNSTNASLIDGFFVDKGMLRFWYCTYKEDWPKTKPKFSQIALANGVVTRLESTQLVLAKTESFFLAYDQSTNEFSIK